MKYFSPSYWLKLWVLSAPFFNDKTQGINARLIDNQSDIKDWASENTTGISVLEQQELNYSNSTEFINYQTQLDSISNQELETSIHKHRHEKNRNRHKRQNPSTPTITTLSIALLIRVFDNYDTDGYIENLQEITEELAERRIIMPASTDSPSTSSGNSGSWMFNPNLPSDNSDLIEMNLITREERVDEETRISLVFASRNLVVQGFILTQPDGTRHYFHFKSEGTDRYADNIPGIDNRNTYNLGFSGSYTSLSGQNKNVDNPLPTNIQSISDSFSALRRLTKFRDYRNNRINNRNTFRGTDTDINILGRNLLRVVMVASESIRTRSIRDNVVKIIEGETINWQTVIRPVATDWKKKSKKLDNDIIIIYTEKQDDKAQKQYCVSKTKQDESQKKPSKRPPRYVDDCLIINSIAILSKDSSVGPIEAKKGTMWIATNDGLWIKFTEGTYPEKVNNLYESVKSVDIDYEGNAYAVADSGRLYFISIRGWNWTAEEINFPISNTIVESIVILQQDSTLSSYVKKGSLWIATDQGVYFRFQNGEYDGIRKIDDLDESIKSVDIDYQGSAYAITHSGNFYYLSAKGWKANKSTNYIGMPVSSVLVLQNNVGDYNKGDLFYGTNNGVYCQEFGSNNLSQLLKINGKIIKIYADYQQSIIYIRNDNGDFFSLKNSQVNKIGKNELRRLKKEIKNDKYVWGDNFTKNINNEHHLSPIFNNTNSNNSISREQNIIDIKEINSILFSNQTDTNYVTNNNVTVAV